MTDTAGARKAALAVNLNRECWARPVIPGYDQRVILASMNDDVVPLLRSKFTS